VKYLFWECLRREFVDGFLEIYLEKVKLNIEIGGSNPKKLIICE
jgi:hypothetical protein